MDIIEKQRLVQVSVQDYSTDYRISAQRLQILLTLACSITDIGNVICVVYAHAVTGFAPRLSVLPPRYMTSTTNVSKFIPLPTYCVYILC